MVWKLKIDKKNTQYIVPLIKCNGKLITASMRVQRPQYYRYEIYADSILDMVTTWRPNMNGLCVSPNPKYKLKACKFLSFALFMSNNDCVGISPPTHPRRCDVSGGNQTWCSKYGSEAPKRPRLGFLLFDLLFVVWQSHPCLSVRIFQN